MLHQIGAGVLGPVFRTHDPDDERLVAVKAFTLDLTPEQAAQLAEDLRRLIAVDIPASRLAALVDAGVEDSVAYLAQQYVAGESLDAAIRQYGPAPAPDAARLISHVADALDAGARVGVFHGTLHPRDILVTPGETHLTGLGVAMAVERVGVRPPVRRPYAAPERETGAQWGAAADVFALAAIAHEVLTGRRAVPGSEEPLPGLEDVTVHDPTALRELLESALDPDPERRSATASEFATAFAVALGLGGAGAVSEPVRPRRRLRGRSSPKLPGLEDPILAMPARQPDGPAEAEQTEPPVAAEPAPVQPDRVRTRQSRKTPVALLRPAPEPELVPLELEVAAVAPIPAMVAGEASHPVPAEADHVDEARVEDEPVGAPEPSEPSLAETPAAADGADREDGFVSDDFRLSMAPVPDGAADVDAGAELRALTEDLARFTPPYSPAPPPPSSPAGDPTGPRLFDTADWSLENAQAGAPPPSEPVRRTPDLSLDDYRAPGSLVSDPPIPRALDPGPSSRSSSQSRRVEPYRPLPPRPRGLVMPVVAGVVAGLVLGVVFGYWWGSRGTVPESAVKPAATAQTVAKAPPAVSGPAPAPVLLVPAPTPTPAASAPVPASGASARPASSTSAPVARPSAKPAAAPVPTATRAGTTAKAPAAKPPAAKAPAAKAPAAKPPAVKPPAAKAPAVKPPAARTTAPRKVPAPAPVSGGAIEIETRPPGVRVRLDNRDVGVSPLVLSGIKDGARTIRLELDGYRPWSTTVTVKAGTRTRIAASLERSTAR